MVPPDTVLLEQGSEVLTKLRKKLFVWISRFRQPICRFAIGLLLIEGRTQWGVLYLWDEGPGSEAVLSIERGFHRRLTSNLLLPLLLHIRH